MTATSPKYCNALETLTENHMKTKSSMKDHHWNSPGGRIKADETPWNNGFEIDFQNQNSPIAIKQRCKAPVFFQLRAQPGWSRFWEPRIGRSRTCSTRRCADLLRKGRCLAYFCWWIMNYAEKDLVFVMFLEQLCSCTSVFVDHSNRCGSESNPHYPSETAQKPSTERLQRVAFSSLPLWLIGFWPRAIHDVFTSRSKGWAWAFQVHQATKQYNDTIRVYVLSSVLSNGMRRDEFIAPRGV